MDTGQGCPVAEEAFPAVLVQVYAVAAPGQEAAVVVTGVPDREAGIVVTVAPDRVLDTGEAIGVRIIDMANMVSVVGVMAGVTAGVMGMVVARDMDYHSISVIRIMGITIRIRTMIIIGPTGVITSTIMELRDTTIQRMKRKFRMQR